MILLLQFMVTTTHYRLYSIHIFILISHDLPALSLPFTGKFQSTYCSPCPDPYTGNWNWPISCSVGGQLYIWFQRLSLNNNSDTGLSTVVMRRNWRSSLQIKNLVALQWVLDLSKNYVPTGQQSIIIAHKSDLTYCTCSTSEWWTKTFLIN